MDPKTLHAQATDRTAFVWNWFATKYYPKLREFTIPRITISNRMKTTGGVCYYEDREIRLSAEMFYYNQAAYIKEIIPHEVIHQIDYDLFKGHMHSKSWKSLMVKFGLEPKVYHNLVNPLHEQRKMK